MARRVGSVYSKIAEDLEAKIQSGIYKTGTLIEPERQLMEIYGVERTTIRRALELLLEKGLIVKVTGKGTYVSNGKGVPVSKLEKASKTSPVAKGTAKANLVIQRDIIGASKDCIKQFTETYSFNGISYIGSNSAVYGALCGELAAAGTFKNDYFYLTSSIRETETAFIRLWRSSVQNPDVVVTSTIEEAEAIIKAAKSFGAKVPGELSVISFETANGGIIGGYVFNEKSVPTLYADSKKDIPVYITGELHPGETLAVKENKGLGTKRLSDFLL